MNMQSGNIVIPALAADELDELLRLLHEALGDLSMEISATDNSEYRAALRARRDRLVSVDQKLQSIAPHV